MKLSLPAMLVLFVLGAVAALVGDHGHVATGTTEYLTHSVPFIGSSPIWFPAMVGVATVSLVPLYFVFGVVAALLGELAGRPGGQERSDGGMITTGAPRRRLHYPR